jgi:pimeloyl-ACP methyl ester carboxylesterase
MTNSSTGADNAEVDSVAANSTTPVIFFPGTLCDERVFMPLWQAMNSNNSLLDNKAFVPLQWAQDLPQMMALSEDRLGYFPAKVHLVGYSMGGYIAALTALAKPNKVASLTLIGSTCKALADKEVQQRMVLLSAIQKKQYKRMTESRVDFMLHKANYANKDIRSTVKSRADDLGAGVLAAQVNASAKRKDLTAALKQQDFDTFFVLGEQDNIATPSEVEEICAASCSPTKNVSKSSQFHFEVIANAGHMLPLEQPELLANYLHQHLA